MAELTIQKLTPSGVEITYASASAAGDHFFLAKDTGYELRVKIITTGTVNATVTGIQLGNQGAALLSNTITLTATSEEAAYIPFYSIDPDSNRVDVTYDNVVNVTVAIVEVAA